MATVLIVEDEPLANKLLTRLVQLRGHQPRSALDAAGALRSIGEVQPDVILLDLMLPDRSGLDVCRELRRDPRTGTTPIVLVTARLASENRLRGFREGATDYLAKPYTPDQIFGALDQALAWRLAAEIAPAELRRPIDTADGAEGHLTITTIHGILLWRHPDQARSITGRIEDLRSWFDRLSAWAATFDGPASAVLSIEPGEDGPTIVLEDLSGWSGHESAPTSQATCEGPRHFTREASDRMTASIRDGPPVEGDPA